VSLTRDPWRTGGVADTEIGILEHGNDLGAAGGSGPRLTIGGGDIAHVPGGVSGSPRKAIHEIKKTKAI
jgi:hypothetical protein